jgi:hypothetical protein
MPESSEIDYAAALQGVGFDREWVARGLQRREREAREGLYDGFRNLVMRLSIGGGHRAFREHHIEPVIRRVEAQEAAARLAERGAQAALRTAATRADEADRRAAEQQSMTDRSRRIRELHKQMTDRELDGRIPMRPEIAEQWRQLFPDSVV